MDKNRNCLPNPATLWAQKWAMLTSPLPLGGSTTPNAGNINQKWVLEPCRLGSPKVGNGYITRTVLRMPHARCGGLKSDLTP